MPITYYSTASNAPLRSGAAPHNYPGKPIRAGVGKDLTIPDLVFASILDVMEGAPVQTPIDVSWLFDIFESVLDERPPLMRVHQYSPLSRSWKRSLSETIANAVSLCIALFEEGFDWAVPVPLIKDLTSLPRWWPWTPQVFCARPLAPVPPAITHSLMPDFLLAGTKNGITTFSSMEVKGRDDPLDTAKFSAYSDFKRQSENIQLINGAGLVLPIQRKILSVVAVRPTLVTPENRELKCRWFNHADMPEKAIPGSLTQIAVLQCEILIRRLFGDWMWLSLMRRNRNNSDAIPFSPHLVRIANLESIDGGYIRRNNARDRSQWRPFIAYETLNLLRALQNSLTETNNSMDQLSKMDRMVEQFMANENSKNKKKGPMMKIGIGLVFLPKS